MPSRLRDKDVFINCPFDEAYKPSFQAILFAVYDLAFAARCALEVDDGSELRLDKILRIIEQCTYGIHDISAVGLSTGTNLPRFNMPLELGLYLGCKRFGGETQRWKACLIRAISLPCIHFRHFRAGHPLAPRGTKASDCRSP